MDRPTFEPKYSIYCRCDECGGDIYYGNYYYNFDGDIICEDCEPSYRKEHFRRCAE